MGSKLIDRLDAEWEWLSRSRRGTRALHRWAEVDGELRERIERLVPRLMVAFFALMTVLVVWTLLLRTEVTATYRDRVWIAAFPVLALVSTVVAWRLIRAGRFLPAFGASALTIALLMATVAAGMYPVMLPSLMRATASSITNSGTRNHSSGCTA